ncbi:hypothetical protein B0T26DRAFT_73464 [Lasiosphaeria miniovina]|uniref:Uncharacterized protein n=1 Tax=Lasiosphaeria miniovina TaxID=1954250 RepID=A0AA40EGG1_9PEZI|nr:uncharacterized protein B0T26DRAFT_73464 [Lasiosphaeria miniovina]KAK0734478.1 hypothetical protein B0T26DRAFT_73464 [Lasiosphaeria miniovina]
MTCFFATKTQRREMGLPSRSVQDRSYKVLHLSGQLRHKPLQTRYQVYVAEYTTGNFLTILSLQDR